MNKPSITRIEDLELVDQIGEGSYSKVYLCRHHETREQYAAKVVSATDNDNEVQVLAALEHPGIANLVATFEKDFERCTVQNHIIY
jgi:serine/threonine protein kinase